MFNQKLHILIVDDNRFYRDGLQLLLKRLLPNSTFEELGDGMLLKDYLKNNRVDLVFIDIKMPNVNGIEATKEATLYDHDLKVIAMTMYSNPQYLHDMIGAGARGYLLKDSNVSEIIKAIKAVLNGQRYYCEEAIKKFDINKVSDIESY